MDDLSLLQILKALSSAAAKADSPADTPKTKNPDMGTSSVQDVPPMPEVKAEPETSKNIEAYTRFIERHENAVKKPKG